jgi:hypothetical protein
VRGFIAINGSGLVFISQSLVIKVTEAASVLCFTKAEGNNGSDADATCSIGFSTHETGNGGVCCNH